MSEYVYALQLSSSKYYIGKSFNVTKRFQEHLDGKGSSWTTKYKPIKILETKLITSQHDENNLTKDYMKKHGIQNVRGGSYTQLELPQESVSSIEKEITGNADKCYKCQQYGHFARNCSYEEEEEYWECDYCDRQFTTRFGCMVHEKKCSQTSGCYRCGRDSHYANNCYASTHVKGYLL